MKRISVLLGIILFTSCAELEPLIDYNPQTDFKTYSSFSICQPFSDDVFEDKSYDSEESREIISEELRKKIESLGYVYDEISPDLLVSYHLKFQEKSVEYTYCRTRGEYEYWSECTLEEYPYVEGTMVVTLMDNAFDQVVWIGSLEEMWPDEDSKKYKTKIQAFVHVLFRDFPLNKEIKEKIR